MQLATCTHKQQHFRVGWTDRCRESIFPDLYRGDSYLTEGPFQSVLASDCSSILGGTYIFKVVYSKPHHPCVRSCQCFALPFGENIDSTCGFIRSVKLSPAFIVRSNQDHGDTRRIYYWSTKLLITRPCVCRIERRISHESVSSVGFNSKAAETCVGAARELTDLFSDQLNTTFIYYQGPWWDVVHISEYFMLERVFDSSDS